MRPPRNDYPRRAGTSAHGAAGRQKAQSTYIRQVAAKSANPACQNASGKSLLDTGAITQAEFDALKAEALA